MGVSMSEDEVWEFLANGHTAVFTTLRRDGWPVSLPVWYLVEDRVIYVSTPVGSKKVLRIRNDDRANLLVERGEAWVELAAVELPVRATILDAGTESESVMTAFGEKYTSFRPASKEVPDATKKHYGGRVVIRLDPAGPPLSWDNARIRMKG